jgi:hypothetical protein
LRLIAPPIWPRPTKPILAIAPALPDRRASPAGAPVP